MCVAGGGGVVQSFILISLTSLYIQYTVNMKRILCTFFKRPTVFSVKFK